MHRPRSVEIEWFAGGVRISWNQLQRRAIFTHLKYDSHYDFNYNPDIIYICAIHPGTYAAGKNSYFLRLRL